MVRVWLRDDQFGRIEALLPGKLSDPGRTAANNRLFVEAVLWIARTGSPWRDLPCEFGPWNSVYQRFARWSRQGLWHQLFAKLAEDADFEEMFIDSTIVRAHQHAAGAPKKKAARPATARRRCCRACSPIRSAPIRSTIPTPSSITWRPTVSRR